MGLMSVTRTCELRVAIDEAAPSSVANVATVLTVGQGLANNAARRILMRFKKGALSAARHIVDSRTVLNLNCVNPALTKSAVIVKRISGSWSSATTWNTRPTVALPSSIIAENLPLARGAWKKKCAGAVYDCLKAGDASIDLELSLFAEASAGAVVAAFNFLLASSPTLTIVYDRVPGLNLLQSAEAMA